MGPITYVLTIVIPIAPFVMLMVLAGACYSEQTPKIVLFGFAIIWAVAGLAFVACGIAYLVTGSQTSPSTAQLENAVLGSFVAGAFAVVTALLCCGGGVCATISGVYCASDKFAV